MTDDAPPPEPSRALTIGEQLGARMSQFSAALPDQIKPEKFARVVLTAIQQKPELVKMDRASLWNACMRAAQDGLLPDGRDGALVPFRGKVQWMVMIGGLRKKVRNSEEIATWEVHAVHAKDEFDYELGDEPFIKHKPSIDGDPGPLIAVYSIAVLKTGEKTREVMTRAEIEYVRDSYAQTDNEGQFSPAWRKSFDEMAKKTVARRHSKVLPMSTDLEEIIRRDDEQIDGSASEKRVRDPRPKQTLTDKLEALANIDPITGEIKEAIHDAMRGGQGFIKDGKRLAPEEVLVPDEEESGEGGTTSAPDGAGAAVSTKSAAPVSPPEPEKPQRDKMKTVVVDGVRQPAPEVYERLMNKQTTAQAWLQAKGDAVAVQGTHALDAWWESLSPNDAALITTPMDRAWRTIAEKADLE